MVNDTNTLNGALQELGELMANNLTEQGVASTYDEGLTTLANKILDIQGGGTTQTLTLTADKPILSYYDRDIATLTATLTGGNVANKTVEFFNGVTSIGTSVTDSNGVATITYTSQGVGYVSLTASVGSLVTETYSIIDAKFYASNSRIESEGTDYNNQRLIFVSDFEVGYEDTIHFRFGDTVPNTLGVGISSKSYSNDVFIEKIGSTTKLYRNVYSTANLNNPFVANHDFCMKPVSATTAGDTNDRCYLYDNDTYTTWYSFKLTNKKVRVDKYYSYPYTIEIIVL